MRIIIAGGSGLIGHELSKILSAEGDEVIILTRRPDLVKGMPVGIKAVQWDGKTLQDWWAQIDNSDVVVNLTGENLSGNGFLPSRWTKERKLRLRQSRVDSGKVLSRAVELVKNKPSVFVQASGVGFYGTQQKTPHTEVDKSGNDFLANLCVEWEASSQPVELMGVRRVVVRNGVVLSNSGGALRFLLLQYKFWACGPLGSGRQVYSWIHIDDEVNAIRFLIGNKQTKGIYNLTSPNPVTNDEFGRTISKVIWRPHYLTIPGIAMRLALGEVTSMVLLGQRVLPQKLIKEGYTFKFPILEDALKDILK